MMIDTGDDNYNCHNDENYDVDGDLMIAIMMVGEMLTIYMTSTMMIVMMMLMLMMVMVT